MKRTLVAYQVSLSLFMAGLVVSGLTAFPWRLLDCSFGIVGAIPLLYCLHLTKKLSNKT